MTRNATREEPRRARRSIAKLTLAALALTAGPSGGCKSDTLPAQQGATTFSFGGGQCGTPAPNATLGAVSASQSRPLVDGNDQTSVNCSVQQNGSTYSFTASVGLGEQRAEFRADNIDPSKDTPLNVSVFLMANGGGVALYSSGSASSCDTSSGADGCAEPCTLSFGGGSTESNLGIAPGTIWASFVCPAMNDPMSPSLPSCAIPSTSNAPPGYLFFDNCDQ